ncbi:hypothetical protein FHS89_000854 [Rubricella aquisinus]|uniref:Uncharacterized protein n=1 Tax=Rubricella aquisinus TaxID=2028108 RepID=A0A840WI94_9RHOB|nr:hypothetical protein [Rubricella aquisinus]MBB5514848.1 hypothetical protein [Rubricella aquisinus]
MIRMIRTSLTNDARETIADVLGVCAVTAMIGLALMAPGLM